MTDNLNAPSDRQILFYVLRFGVGVVVLMATLTWFLRSEDTSKSFAQRYVVAEIVGLTDVSSGTGVTFDVHVRIDRGAHHYVSDRYKNWTFVDVDSAKIDLTQKQVCVLQWAASDLPRLVQRDRCASLRAS